MDIETGSGVKTILRYEHKPSHRARALFFYNAMYDI